MLYAKQVCPEYQEDDLFYFYKDKNTDRYELGMNDDYYVDNLILDGNRDFCGITTNAYNKLKKLSDLWLEWESAKERSAYKSYSSFANATEFIEWYVPRDNGKKYSKKDIHAWIELIDNWNESEEDFEKGLFLITGKVWRSITIRGCSQNEWQEGFASEELSSASVNHIEMCYFNNGMEFIVYESKEDFDNEENGYSIYVEDIQDLRDRVGESIVVFEFDGYVKTATYKEVSYE